MFVWERRYFLDHWNWIEWVTLGYWNPITVNIISDFSKYQTNNITHLFDCQSFFFYWLNRCCLNNIFNNWDWDCDKLTSFVIILMIVSSDLFGSALGSFLSFTSVVRIAWYSDSGSNPGKITEIFWRSKSSSVWGIRLKPTIRSSLGSINVIL